MELHPILEKHCSVNPNLWYVLSAFGECPSVRVGHTLNYIPGAESHSGKVYVVGGANPSGSFAETFVLDLDTFSWDTIESPSLRARYEHSSFISSSQPSKIYVFGGADQGRNHNDVQMFDTDSGTWTAASPGGTPPSARTYHNTTVIKDQFIVYSGGQSGADPVGDRQVHCFNVVSNSWSTLNIHGDSPKPRHGHLVVTVGNKVFVHGGMSGQTFYDDLHILDLDKNSWSQVKQKKVFPSARAAHSAACLGTDLYVFGGMGRHGALDDLYKLDTVSLKWTKLTYDGPPPASRLDAAICVVRLCVPLTPPSVQETLESSAQAKDILESQLRLSSAGSSRSFSSGVGSPGSAGSERSISSLTGSPGLTQEDREALVVEGVRPPPEVVGEASSYFQEESEIPDGPTKLVDLLLLFGGMDTEGEIFDDTLVYLLNEQLQETAASGGSDAN